MLSIEPQLHPIDLKKLHPTQLTVGFREVEAKVEELKRRLGKRQAAEWLGTHQIPVVLGPKDVPYLIDHHHLCLALLRCGQEHVLGRIEADLSFLKPGEFWGVIDSRNWAYPYDQEGRRQTFDQVPDALDKLVDDRYRSLAGLARKAGAYAKTATPYAEFQWANYFRRCEELKRFKSWKEATRLAVRLAHKREARYLPGFVEGE